jgi:hypothetical protein
MRSFGRMAWHRQGELPGASAYVQDLGLDQVAKDVKTAHDPFRGREMAPTFITRATDNRFSRSALESLVYERIAAASAVGRAGLEPATDGL